MEKLRERGGTSDCQVRRLGGAGREGEKKGGKEGKEGENEGKKEGREGAKAGKMKGEQRALRRTLVPKEQEGRLPSAQSLRSGSSQRVNGVSVCSVPWVGGAASHRNMY